MTEETPQPNGNLCKQENLVENTSNEANTVGFLKTCFEVLMNRKQLFISPEYTKHIYNADLNISLSNFDEVLQSVLLDCIVYFMVVWPGWKKSIEYFKGQPGYKDFYEEFRQYLITQVKDVIENDTTYKKNAIKKGDTLMVDNHTQTEPASDKDVKPESKFALKISGPPKALNSLIFFTSEDDIALKKYSMRHREQGLTFQQLLNYPYFGIVVKMMGLSFKRVNKNEYSRYLSYSHKISVTPTYEHICSIKLANYRKYGIIQCGYTCDYIREYLHQYIEVLARTHKDISPEDICDLSHVCEELISDIQEININHKSIATNTVINFNIGEVQYVRSRKVAQNVKKPTMKSKSVNFFETITPKIELTFDHFSIKQDVVADKISFLGLNSAYTDTTKLPPKFEFMCIFCKVYSNRKQDIIKHFEEEHGTEQPVLCFKCRKELEISFLTENRWRHLCVPVP